MSAIEEAIFTRATTGPTLQPLIGTRCYNVQLPQAPTLPALTYQRIVTVRDHAMGTDTGLAHPTFQLTAFAATRPGAQAVAEAVKTDFRRWKGTVAGVVIQDTMLDDQVDLPFDDDVEVHMVPVDVVIHHLES